MKKIALLVASFILFSCSSEDDNNKDPYKNHLIVDYDVHFYPSDNNTQIEFNDLTITSTNSVYVLLNDKTNTKTLLSKVSENGTKSEVLNDLRSSLGNGLSITSALNDKLFFNSDVYDNSNKIFSYDNVQLNSHAMNDNGPNYYNKAKITTMARYSNNSIVAFDHNNSTLKFYLPQDNLESTIAGSGSAAITDGNGLNASFKYVSKIVCKNNKIYVVDDSKNLRKIEYINNVYNVSTLVSNYSEYIDDIAVDSNDDVYALVNGKGILKLNKTTNTLDLFKTGNTNTISQDKNTVSAINWEYGVFNMYINGSDLYVVNGLRIVKISDFKSKI